MRTNRWTHQGHGLQSRTQVRRIAVFLDPVDFEKIVSRARACEVGNCAIAREIIEAWCHTEPLPIFVGIDERS